MTTRDVRVRLSVENSQAIAGLKQTGAAAEQVAGQMTRAGSSSAKHWDTIGKYSGRAFLAGAAGLAVMERANYKFDQSMSRVDAATHARVATLESLRTAAIKAGADSVFSASEAADAETELAKAGVKTRDILGGGLTGALNLASAGELGVAQSAEYMATALTQFQLPGTKATHVADLLAAGAGKAQGEVSDMALALNYAGVPAAQLGVSIEETAGTIALLAKNGILGEKAGTGLRGILSSLTSPSAASAKEMKRLGISVFDAQGNFIGLDGLAGQLHNRLSGLTQAERSNALGRIFGNAQLTAANVLYREGAKGVHTWTKNVNDSGYAADTAKRKLNNLAGDVEYLKGDLDSLFLQRGGGAQDGLRDFVQGIDKAVVGFTHLPDAVQSGVVKVIALGTATAGALFLVSKLVKGYREISGLFGAGKSVAGAAASAVGVQKVYVVNLPPGGTGLPGGPGSTTVASPGSSKKPGVGLVGGAAIVLGAAYAAKTIYDASGPLRDAMKGATDALDSGNTKSQVSALTELNKQLDKSTNLPLVDLEKYKSIAEDIISLDVGGALKKSFAADTITAVVAALGGAKGKAEELRGALNGAAAAGAGLGLVTPLLTKHNRLLATLPHEIRTKIATPGAITSMSDVRRLAREYDLTPRQVRTVVRLTGAGPAKSATNELIRDLTRLGNKHPNPKASLNDHAKGPIKTLDGLLGKVGRTNAKPKVSLQDNATAKINAVRANLSRLNGQVAFTTAVTLLKTTRVHKDGGYISGPGGPRDDAIDARLSNGEFVVNAAATRANRGLLENINAQRFAAGGPVGAVTGGRVGDSVTVTFPAPTVLAASVKAADEIAVAAANTARSARDTRAAHLQDLTTQQQIRDLARDLRRKETVEVTSHGKKHKVKRLAVRGLDRTIAEAQLADARAQLLEDRAQVANEAKQALADARTEATQTFASSLDFFTRGSSPTAVLNQVNRWNAEAAQYGNVLGRLRDARVSPAILARVKALGDSGDFKSAARFGQALLDQPDIMAQLNASLAVQGQIASGVGALTTDPRFLGTGVWNASAQTGKLVQVAVGLDTNQQTAEIVRQVVHIVQGELVG